MGKSRSILIGAIVAAAGLVFTLQGIGVLTGSTMSNTTFWSIAGPVIMLVGLVVVWRGVRGPSA